MEEDAETGIFEYRLVHLDRILFGSNTILVFKYPLLKRKMFQVKTRLLEQNPQITEEELEAESRKILAHEGLI